MENTKTAVEPELGIPKNSPNLSEYINKKERIWRVLKINWILLGILAAVLLLLTIFCCYRYMRHKKAKRLVRGRSDQEKLTDINQALRPFGFAYSLRKDIFYSLEDAWQRAFGYGKIYDEMAPVMNMMIDCEPIYFEYDQKRWMIELWKGQYGITTGAEVGIYRKENVKPEEKPEDIFYECVSGKEQLPISMTLYKNGKVLFQREQNHWWLTGFVLGEFSYPGELILEASVTFEDPKMLEAFVKGCYQAGYQPDDLHVWCSRVALRLYQPHTPQASHYGKIYRTFIQWQNHHNCKRYQQVTKEFSRTIDKLDYLMMAYPRLFGIIIKTGKIAWEKKKK